MDFKEEIKKTLNDLKVLGYSRRMVEEEIGYSPKGIDQALSRGGNKSLLEAVQAFLAKAKHGGITTEEEVIKTATIQLLFNEVAKLKAKSYDRNLPEVIDEMDQNIALLAKDIFRKKV